MTSMVLLKARKRRVVKRILQRIAEERETDVRSMLTELWNKYGNQDGIAKDLGVSQGTVSREMWLQGMFEK